MFDERRKELIDCRNALLNALTVADDRATRGRANEDKVNSYRKKLYKIDEDLQDLISCGNHLRDIYKNIESYSVEHSKKARAILDLAIAEAGALVPDADVLDIQLNYNDNKTVDIVNSRKESINIREGGGYRATLGALLKYASIKAQPDALQFMLYDEYFFTLSDVTTASWKTVFQAMKKDITIVCIEQRRNAMDGIVDVEYQFKKDASKNTTVSKVF